ncbi:MAG: hypothetical protein MjAS7_1976 [Metallosphaera javensis (ex Sakai et al. 2022)]|nr:MAG: hypothetical protein MjAS7_1976 [Metallosphaera javensis (ex Sakai et al. 2022)]
MSAVFSSFKPSKDLYKLKRIALYRPFTFHVFQTLKGSLQTLFRGS